MITLLLCRARFVLLCIGALVLASCGQASQPSQQRGSSNTPSTFTPVLAVSELVVGPNRLAFGVVKDGTPLNDPKLTLDIRFFALSGADKTQAQSEATALYRGEGLPFGIYVGYADFNQPGPWEAEVSIVREGQQPQISRIRLDVLAKSSTLVIGSKAIASTNLTIKEQPDLAKLTSDLKPDADLYQLTIADALAMSKPFLVAFSTPGYCQTAVCGPNMLVIKRLKEQYQGQVNFIHIEVYSYPFSDSAQQGKRVEAMNQWNLQTEPWTFLVDGQGVVQARYEGGITFTEMEPALQQLAVGQPVKPMTAP